MRNLIQQPVVTIYPATNQLIATWIPAFAGMTGDLESRFIDNREGHSSKFAMAYQVIRLVWYEGHDQSIVADQREKSMKITDIDPRFLLVLCSYNI